MQPLVRNIWKLLPCVKLRNTLIRITGWASDSASDSASASASAQAGSLGGIQATSRTGVRTTGRTRLTTWYGLGCIR